MRTSSAAIRVLALLVITFGARAGSQDRPDPLAPLRFLAGSCWRAEISGGDLVDVQCVEEIAGGFLRSRHAVFGTKPEYSGETLYFVDAETETARFVYFTSLGGVSRGSVVAEGGRLVFPDQRHVARDGAEMRLYGRLERVAADAFRSENRRWVKGAWTDAVRMTFTRLPASCRNLEQARQGCAEG